MDNKLRPCPFCENDKLFMITQTRDCYSSSATVRCIKCGAKIEVGIDESGSSYPNPVENWREVAIYAWNHNTIYKRVTIKEYLADKFNKENK